jgi:hypothetical protein
VTLATSRGAFPKPQPGDPFRGDPATGLVRDIDALADAIAAKAAFRGEGPLASRPSTTDVGSFYFATDDRGGTMSYFDGSAWNDVGPRDRILTSLTSLPAGYTPRDGDRAQLQFSQVTGFNGTRIVRWPLVYDGSPVGAFRSDALRRWLPVGAAPIATSSNPVDVTASSGSWTSLFTNQLPIPAPGRYLCEWWCRRTQVTGGSLRSGFGQLGQFGVRAWAGSGTKWVDETNTYAESPLVWDSGAVTWADGPGIAGIVEFIASDVGRVDLMFLAQGVFAPFITFYGVRCRLTPLELGL